MGPVLHVPRVPQNLLFRRRLGRLIALRRRLDASWLKLKESQKSLEELESLYRSESQAIGRLLEVAEDIEDYGDTIINHLRADPANGGPGEGTAADMADVSCVPGSLRCGLASGPADRDG